MRYEVLVFVCNIWFVGINDGGRCEMSVGIVHALCCVWRSLINNLLYCVEMRLVTSAC